MKCWSEETVSDKTKEGWAGLLDELLALEPDKEGKPIDLPLTDEAKAVWVAYYDEHAQREAEEDGPLRAAMSKLEATTARLALVMQLASDPQSTEVGAEAMRAGITLSGWFERQARRVYRGIEESEEERHRQELYDWIADRGGSVTKR